MKKISYLFISGLIMVSIAAVAFKHNNNKTNIAFTETKNSYQLKAYYNAKETKDVARYIDAALKPEAIFQQQADLDRQVVLHDHTRFYIKVSAGKLLLRLDKTANTKAGFDRIRKICQGVAKDAIR